MGCYFTLWYNTYSFSLLFYKIYMKRVNADRWNSGPERSKSDIPILRKSKCLETLQRIILECIKNGKEIPKGDPPGSHKPGRRTPWTCGAPGRPPKPIFSYMMPSDLEKNQKEDFGTKHRQLEAEPGMSTFALRQSDSAGDTPL